MTTPGLSAGAAAGEVRRSVVLPAGRFLRRLAFFGPGSLVATGYMDPGNWATALAAGSRYGATLLFVAVASSLMAILLQWLAIRLGIGGSLDLAQACRAHAPRPARYGLWFLAEAGIVATDLAEVIGTAIGLQLLFGLPLAVGIVATGADALLILALERAGFRKLELFVLAMLGLIGFCFAAQLFLARPDPAEILRGLVPTARLLSDPEMLYLALGILGATVMPHNLFLHSFAVQTRRLGAGAEAKREALRYAAIDSAAALLFALLVNGAILVLAASVFYRRGYTSVVELGQAHQLMAPLLGAPAAATLFALALIACGLASTVTATLAGQVVMEGFLEIRLPPTLRRLITRLIAIAPAITVTLLAGEAQTARLLVLSQVALSATLPFAVVPLVIFTARRDIMGDFVAPRGVTAAAAVIAALIVTLDVVLIGEAIGE